MQVSMQDMWLVSQFLNRHPIVQGTLCQTSPAPIYAVS